MKKLCKSAAILYVATVIVYGAIGGVSLAGAGWAIGDILLITYIMARK